MIWIALHLPSLSLESFEATLPCGGGPVALADTRQILGANAAARARGVQPGLKRATALALAPQLTLGQADPARDAQALTAVAHTALAFTPAVSIQPAAPAHGTAPDTVLLEVLVELDLPPLPAFKMSLWHPWNAGPLVQRTAEVLRKGARNFCKRHDARWVTPLG